MALPDCAISHSYSVWSSLVVQHLGREMKHHIINILHNIVAVDRSVKTAYLLDFGIKSLNNLVNLLHDLFTLKCVVTKLSIYVMDMDILIVNPQCILSLQKQNNTDMLLVNVSSCLVKPELYPSSALYNDIEQFIQKLPVNTDSISAFKIETENINLTTVFGLLIGYPYIYWFDKNTDQNCLSMEPLCCFKVTWTLEIEDAPDSSGKTQTIFSFSLPECLVDQYMKMHLDKWFSSKTELISHLQLSTSVETLPSVAL